MATQPRTGAPATFVPETERERFLLTLAELIYERGYEAVELEDLAQRLGVEVTEIERYWPSKRDCVLEAIDTSAERAFGSVVRTFMSAGSDGPVATHRSVATLLEVLAANPALASLAILAPEHLDHRDSTHRTGLLDVFADFLGPGLAALGSTPPGLEVVAVVLSGGLFGLLKRYATEHRLHALRETLPAVSHVCVSAFFGREEAERAGEATAPRPLPG